MPDAPAPMVQIPAETVEKLREAVGHRSMADFSSRFHRESLVTAARAVVDAATPAVSVPAADILALANEWERIIKYRDHSGELRALVAAAEQADKGEGGQRGGKSQNTATPHDPPLTAPAAPPEPKRKWRKGRLDLPAVPVGELHDSDASKCRRPNCESMHYSHLPATDPTVLKDEATKGLKAARVPVNDEAETEEAAWNEWNRWGESVTQTPMIREAHRAGFRAARGEDA